MRMRLFLWVALVGTPYTLLAQEHHPAMDGHAEKAVCVLTPTEGNHLRGLVTFTQKGKEVQVVVHIEGVTPNKKHGFHVHQYGDCSAPDGTSAGGHYNPSGMSHGAPVDAMRHKGDLGNVSSNNKGVVDTTFTDLHLKLNGPDAIIGRSMILHKDEDDLKTQPTGNAGARIACGVIGIAKP